MVHWIFSILASVITFSMLAPTEAAAYAFAASKSSDGEYYEWCTAGTLDAAEACATRKCESQTEEDCRVVTRCSNGLWSGIAEVKFVGNIRRHGSACGFTTLNAVKTKMVSECKRVKKLIKPVGTHCAATIVDKNANDTPRKFKWIWRNGVLNAQ